MIDSFGAAPDAGAVEARIVRAIDHDQHKWWRIGRYGSIAAALALAVGAALWLSRPVDAAAYDDSVDDHIICALAYPPDTTYDAQRAWSSLDDRYRPIVDAVTHEPGEYRLIDAHMCPYQGRNYAHLVYRDRGQSLSVFVESADRGRLPLRHETPRKGFVTEGTSTGRHQVFVVSDVAAPPPKAIVEELMRSALAFVRKLEQ